MRAPVGAYLAVKMSEAPLLVSVVLPKPGSKSTLPVNEPVTSTLPAESTTMALAVAMEVPDPGRLSDHARFPAESYLARKTSWLPVALRLVCPGPVLKKVWPLNCPARYKLPVRSCVMALMLGTARSSSCSIVSRGRKDALWPRFNGRRRRNEDRARCNKLITCSTECHE